MAKDAKGHGSDARGGGVDQSKPLKDAGIIRAKGISAMYGPGSPGYPNKQAATLGPDHPSVGASLQAAAKAQLNDLRTNPSGPHVAAGVDKSGRTVPVTVSDADAAKALAGGGAKSAAVPVHSGAAGRSPLDASGMSLDRPAAGQRNAQGYRTQGTAYEGPRYNRDAVNNAIASSNRSGRKIGGREASLIHRLLKGRQVGDQ